MLCFRGSWCSKSRLAKAAGAEVAVQQRNEKLHAAVVRSTFSSQNVQSTSAPKHFLYWIAVVRSTFWSEHVQKMAGSEHSLYLRCGKNCTPLWREAHLQVKMLKNRRCRTTFWTSDVEKLHEKRVFKSKCWKTEGPGALFEGPMWKNGMLLWWEMHFQFKMLKNWRSGNIFWRSDVENLHAAVARSTFVRENVENTSAADSFFEVLMSKIARGCGEKHIYKSRCTKYLRFGALVHEKLVR